MPARIGADLQGQQSINLKAVAVIPARWGSVRFPGKPMALLAGTPIIVHVCAQAAKTKHIQRVVCLLYTSDAADD
jgi:CMP-2-keto-3-deoxyoctulosonic acid synthetase